MLVLPGSRAAQARVEKPNDLSIEPGGECLLYSLNFNRTIGPSFSHTAGASYGGGSNE